MCHSFMCLFGALGDIYPRSDWGKVIGAFVIVSGVGYLAMPLAIIGSQFGEVWKDRAILLVLGGPLGETLAL